jgi:hypothetical protein
MSQWSWHDQGSPPGGIIEEIGVLTVMDTPQAAQRPHVFVVGKVGTDLHVWVNYWDGANWQWHDQGSPPGGIAYGVGVLTVMNTPQAAQRPHVFVVGADGHLWVNWWDGANWHWHDQGLPPGGITQGVGVLTVMNTPQAAQRPYAFVMGGTDGHLWVNWWDGANWQWHDQGVPPGSTPGLVIAIAGGTGVLTVMNTPQAAQRPHAFIMGTDYHLWVNWWDGANWQWHDQGSPPGGIAQGIGFLTVMDTPQAAQRPYAFVGGGDGHVWVNYWDGANWHWHDQGSPPGGVVNEIGVLTVMDTPQAAQRPYVFVGSADGHLWVNYWDGANWHWHDQGSPQGVPPGWLALRVGVLTVMNTPQAAQRPYAFVMGADGHMWVNWWS